MHAIAAQAAGANAGATIAVIIGLLAAVAAYWSPTIISAWRHLPDTGSVAVWNFFGWFFAFPWIIAMTKAVRSRPVAPQYVVPPGFTPQQQTPPSAGFH